LRDSVVDKLWTSVQASVENNLRASVWDSEDREGEQ
jgi:hypothetical protein